MKSGKKSGYSRFSIVKREVVPNLQHGCGLRRWLWLFKWREKSCSDKEAFTFIKNWKIWIDCMGLRRGCSDRVGKGLPWRHSRNGPDKIKFEGNGKNNLYASRKILPELEFGTRVDLNCTIHGRVRVPYLNKYNCVSTKVSLGKFTLFNLRSGGIRPEKIPH